MRFVQGFFSGNISTSKVVAVAFEIINANSETKCCNVFHEQSNANQMQSKWTDVSEKAVWVWSGWVAVSSWKECLPKLRK